MKNGKNKKLNENEKCNTLQKTNLKFNSISKKMLYYLIILDLVIQKISSDINLSIKGDGPCSILTNDNHASRPTVCEPISSGLKCDLSEAELTITFKNDIKSARNMFKNCYSLNSINFSSFFSAPIEDTSGMFENCIKLKTITFGSNPSSSVTNMSHMFYNCSSLDSINFNSNFITNLVIDMSFMFTNCSSISELNLGQFITNDVQNMSHMFELCTKLTTLTQTFHTQNVVNMEHMFSNCNSLFSLDISNFIFKKVTNMNSMFKDCTILKQLSLPNSVSSDTPALINMGSMFQSCSSLETINLEKFTTQSVQFMNDLFHDCTKLNNIEGLQGLNTENVIKMESMFENCKRLEEIKIPNFYTPSVRQMHNLFSGCTSVTNIDISKFDTFQITNFVNIFYNCINLGTISIGHFVTNMASDMSYMFYNCSKLNSLVLTNFNTERVLKMTSMFQGCSSLETLDISNFQNNQVMDISYMFEGCEKLTELKIDSFNTASVKNMASLFAGCSSLTKLDLTNFETTNVLNMKSIFSGCFSLTSIILSSFNTSNVVDMSYMFYDCSSLFSINLSNFDTSKVESMESMFYNCKALKSLSVIAFDTSKMQSMKSMFHGCSFIEVIDLSLFNTRNVYHMDDLFYGCSSLIRLDISNFYINRVVSMEYMFNGCKSITSLILPNFKRLSVINTAYMFAGCSSLTSMELSYFDTHAVMNMDYMFAGCTYLRYLNIDNWNTQKVLSMNYMFSGCASLTSLDISSFVTPELTSTKGMFYGCYSLQFMDLTNLDTSKVTSMAYMFYKATSLKSLQFSRYEYSDITNSTELIRYFNTSLVTNMKYMFAFCKKLEYIDLSFLDTSEVVDMSYMFAECPTLTSANLSSFNTLKVTTMESMFYRCLNLSYINLNISDDTHGINMNNILNDTLRNMVFCINKDNAKNLNTIISEKGDCTIIYCEDNYLSKRRKLIIEGTIEKSTTCIDLCKNCQEPERYDYLYNCYIECPDGQFEKKDTEDNEYRCYPDSERKPPCTIQKVLINNCTLEEILDNKYNNKYTDTTSGRQLLIKDLKKEIENDFTLVDYIKENGIVSKTIFEENYQFSLLSDKNMYPNLTYINIQDCENHLKKKKENFDENEELFLLKIEYYDQQFQIPIIEYTVYSKDGEEWNISECDSMQFIYSIPIEINETIEYKYNPDSEYNNELCFQFTTENNTDIILYDRRKEFNDNNISLCESNCKYKNYYNKRVECECPVKKDFNNYLSIEEKEEKYNLVYRFNNNKIQSFNFWVLKCFKMLFSKKGFKGIYPSILYVVLIVGNIIAAIFFCLNGYKVLFSQIQILSERLNMNKDKKKSKAGKGKQNIITTGNNPPPRTKGGDLISDEQNKVENSNQYGSRVNAPSGLINSNNAFKGENGGNISMLNQLRDDDAELYENITEMETNMLTYLEAKQKDKRGCMGFYLSFLKTRQLIMCIFTNDYNSLIIKICFIPLIFGLSLGVNTFFFNDKAIQKIYQEGENYNISKNITYHITSIIISTIITSIIKSLIILLSFTDVAILDIKGESIIPREDKINKALIKVTSKSSLFFIVNFVILTLCWVYTGTFCTVFKNTQLFLIINSAISFVGVLFLPFFYCLFPAVLRMIALNGENSSCLYKISQIFELI